MKRTFMMPHLCKIIGWVVMVPMTFFWVVWIFGGRSIDDTPLLGSQGIFFNTALWNAVDVIMEWNAGLWIVVLAVSMLMVAFSRERDEDEYTAALRAKSLMLAFYIDFVFLVVTAFTVFDFDYLNVMAVQMFLILLLHIVLFNVSMAVIRRRRGHEE